ncbi:MICOS complex subunit mic25a [Clupea harengus]|uniref:MICOS complex subunit mic25a n=1 Tax=Clupea harengus TaxID=7950 RepID=A0A8M1KIT1_CLUHA|nr:MICOS complex subunit mic25a [Clupea harengus]
MPYHASAFPTKTNLFSWPQRNAERDCIQAKQLNKKEAELQQLSAFYKEQLLLLEKKNMDFYQQAADQYNQAADKAEAHIQPRHVLPICPGLQSQVLNCYKENQHQTLLCSSLAKEYMNCINTAKKNTMVNHG